MKTLILMIILLLGMLAPAPPARAEYLGQIQQVAGYSIEVDSTGKTALTIFHIDKRGRIASMRLFVFDGNGFLLDQSIPAGTVRIIMEVDTQGGSTGAVFKITSGTNRFEIPANPEARPVMDII